jgi:hypothetical protein
VMSIVPVKPSTPGTKNIGLAPTSLNAMRSGAPPVQLPDDGITGIPAAQPIVYERMPA